MKRSCETRYIDKTRYDIIIYCYHKASIFYQFPLVEQGKENA